MSKRFVVTLVVACCIAGVALTVWGQADKEDPPVQQVEDPTEEVVEDIEKLEERLTEGSVTEPTSPEATKERARVDQLGQELSLLKKKLEVSSKAAKREQNLNETIFRYGLPIIIAFILILTALNIAPRILAIMMKRDEVNGHENESEMLYTITVFLVIISILVLGSRGIVEGQSLSTILAAIVSFVLGSMSKEKAKKRKKSDEN